MPPRGSSAVVPLERSPAEAIRLISEWSAEAVALNYPDAEAGGRWAIDRIRSGELNGRLWMGPRDEAVGIAWGDHAPGVGRRYCLQLSPGFRHPEALRAFFEALQSEASGDGPVVGLYDNAPGSSQPSLEELLRPLGWFHVVRQDLVFPADRAIPSPPGVSPAMRRLGPADSARLSRLLELAYAEDAVERALFLRSFDPSEDARVAIEGLLGHEVGEWMPQVSFGVDAGEELAGATLVHRFRGILISEVMVAPAHRQHGLASHMLTASLTALREAGESAPRLVVTLRNQRAFRLYRRLGFELVPGAVGGVWLNLPALGIPPPPPTVE